MSDYTLLTPGPTPIPPSVLKILSEPILHHRTKEFGEIFTHVLEELKKVFRTKNTVLILTSSGTGAMEAAVVNALTPGDRAFVASAGVFGNRWSHILKAYSISHEVQESEWSGAVDLDRFTDYLKAKGRELKAVFLTHTETSTGVVNDIKALSRAVREHSDALVVVDSVSGLGAQELETDSWGLDVVISGSQKGLMNAPGLAFVALSERARAAAEKAGLPRYYWDFLAMQKSLPNKETPFTPAIGLVCAQAEALRLLQAEGLENVWARTRELAKWTRSEVRSLGFTVFAKDPCDVLTSFEVPPEVNAQVLLDRLLEEHRVSMAGGQERLKGRIVRIAHMGYIRKSDLKKGFAALKAVLSEMQPAIRS